MLIIRIRFEHINSDFISFTKNLRVHFSLQMAKKIKVSLSTLSSSPGKHMVLKFIWLVLIKDRSEFWSQDKQKPLLPLSSLMMSVLWDHNRNKDGPYSKAAYFYHHLHFFKLHSLYFQIIQNS